MDQSPPEASNLPTSFNKMRRCSSEVSLTDMILANVQVPRRMSHSQSMVSLSQALVNPNPEAEVLWNASMENINHLRDIRDQLHKDQLVRIHKNKPRKSSSDSAKKSERRRRRYHQQSSSAGTDGLDDCSKPTGSTRSKDGRNQSKASSIRRSTHSRKASSFIKKVDVRTSMAKRAPIPKWIEVEIKSMDRHASPTPPHEDPPPKPTIQKHIDKNMMPLADIAMILSNNLDGAIARGLFETRMDKKPETDTGETSASPSTIKSYLQGEEHKDGCHRFDTVPVVEFRPAINTTQAA